MSMAAATQLNIFDTPEGGKDALSKLLSVVVEPTHVISRADTAALARFDAEKRAAFIGIDAVIAFLATTTGGDGYAPDRIVTLLEDQRRDVVLGFFYKVINHFREAYRVDLEFNLPDSSYRVREVADMTVSEVTAAIVSQLSGFSFAEVAEQRVKEALKKVLGGYKSVGLSGARITISNFIYWNKMDLGFSSCSIPYTSGGSLLTLEQAINHFESGDTGYASDSETFEGGLHGHRRPSAWFEKPFEANPAKFKLFKTLRFFKNGNIALTFADAAAAERFRNQYMNG